MLLAILGALSDAERALNSFSKSCFKTACHVAVFVLSFLEQHPGVQCNLPGSPAVCTAEMQLQHIWQAIGEGSRRLVDGSSGSICTQSKQFGSLRWA